MKELVAKIGMTENGFAYSLKNKTVKLITLEKIAEVLEVPVGYFFGEESERKEAKEIRNNCLLCAEKDERIKELKENLADLRASLASKENKKTC